MSFQQLKAQFINTSQFRKFLSNRDKDSLQTEHTYIRPQWQKVEIDFLNSYYGQDGNNGAVTGGLGTERLTDFTQKIIVKMPTNEKTNLKLDAAYDYYSSASTDNIDKIRSSDSRSDVRSQFGIGYDYQNTGQISTNARLGTSIEYDYFSMHGGAGIHWLSKNGNSGLALSFQAFIDQWLLIYPVELRGEVQAHTNRRQSYNVSLMYQQVLSKRLQGAIMLESTFMNGLLSTPFHRVYFDNQSLDIERLPSQRLKIPIAARLNYHLSDRIILRTYYRYYYDSWGMEGHTASIEVPIKINRFFAIYPQYRYHTQTAIDFFAPYGRHTVDEPFYTSDFDLSALNSQSFGLGIFYSRPEGLIAKKIPFTRNQTIKLESIDFKTSYYERSTGLKAGIVSVGAKISF